MSERLERCRKVLADLGLSQALLSHPETLAYVAGYSAPVEDWPVAHPFLAGPALLAITSETADLIVPHVQAPPDYADVLRTTLYRSYDFEQHPDPWSELADVLARLPFDRAELGVEASTLPLRVTQLEPIASCRLQDVTDQLIRARLIKSEDEIEAIRRASRLADIAQYAVKGHVAPGMSEVELAALAHGAVCRAAGTRVPAILTVCSETGNRPRGEEATTRPVQRGDLVLTDVSPWIGGMWSDSANAVCVGRPSREQRRIFDAVNRALELAIKLCRPGAVACEIDREVRASLADWSPTYSHHTGHGLGAAWSEEPRITPYNTMRIEENMVLAVEPAVYSPAGPIRLEHVLVVRSEGNELLTQFQHTL